MTFRKHWTKPSRADGFTLIEVMISLTIMAMITTVAFAGLSIGVDSWRRGTKKIEEIDARSTVERLLKRQLALAYSMEIQSKDQGKPVVIFRGMKNRIDFIADYSLIDGPADFRKIAYEFQGGSFRYEEKRLYGYAFSPDETVNGESLASFHSLDFRFLTENELKERVWVDEWEYGKGLPLAVEAKIDSDTVLIRLVNRR